MKYKFSKEVEYLKKKLDYFLFKKSEPIVISLQGYWGIGKTYFWHNYIKDKTQENNKGNKHVYISLFGINSLNDIKREIILKVSKVAKHLNKMEKIFSKCTIYGIGVAPLLSLFEPRDFKDIIICFDDFERLSPGLNMSEVLGFISELKEQYQCKIVLINNIEVLEEQSILEHKKIIKVPKNISIEKHGVTGVSIEKKNNERYIITNNNNYEIFNTFSEKIVDIVLKYEPSIDDLLNILKKDEYSYINFDFIGSLFRILKNKNKKFNLRLIKQLINKLEVIKDILINDDIDESYKLGLIFNIFKLLVGEKDIKSNEIIDFHNINSSVLYKDDLADLIYKHKFNNEKISELLKEETQRYKLNKEIQEYKKNVEKLYYKYLYDLEYDDKTFAEEFSNLLQSKDYDAVNIFGLANFNWYMDLLLKIDGKNESKYKKFYLDKIKEYIQNNIDSIEKIDNFLEHINFLNDDEKEELKEYYKSIKKDVQMVRSSNKQEILKIIQNILQKNGWNSKIENTLNSLDKDQHLKWLKGDPFYFEKVLFFIGWLQGFSGSIPFKKFYDKTIEVYKELFKKDKYRNKMKIISRIFNLKLNDND